MATGEEKSVFAEAESSVLGDAAGERSAGDAAARLEQLKGDEAYMRSYLSGDKAKVAEFTRLHEQAYRHDHGADVAANSENFPVPASPLDYGISFPDANVPVEQKIELGKEIR